VCRGIVEVIVNEDAIVWDCRGVEMMGVVYKISKITTHQVLCKESGGKGGREKEDKEGRKKKKEERKKWSK
jgi:hypothetical protein